MNGLERRSAVRPLLLAAVLAFVVPTALRGEPAPFAGGAPRGCHGIVDEAGQMLPQAMVQWVLRHKPSERASLDRQCEAVGPIVARVVPAAWTPKAEPRALVVAAWNVHVGGGDVDRLIEQLIPSGDASGASAADYVLILEEAYREGSLVPVAIDRSVPVPRRIAPRPREHRREDIVSLARRRGLAIYYVPSMRNGKGPPFEDRGNAILSTLPLSALTAIELPFGRQRRVASSAVIEGLDGRRRPWRVRVVNVHLDALAAAKRLWIFATAWRGHQARTLLEALDEGAPTIAGADLNTWLGGRWESAYRQFAQALPSRQPLGTAAAIEAHGRLEYMFFRLPDGWTSGSRRLSQHFESDHRPIVATVQIP